MSTLHRPSPLPSRCGYHLHKNSMLRRACLPFTPNPPGRTCLPSLLYATLYDSNVLAYPASHPTRSRMHSLVQNCKLAQKLLAYPVAPAPPPLGRSLLPTLSTASHQDLQRPGRARVHCVGRRFPGHAPCMATEPSAGWLLVRQTGSPLCPPCPARPGDAELDQVPFLSLLTLHFPSGKALSPSRALATKSRGDPPVNARLLGGPFHWEI